MSNKKENNYLKGWQALLVADALLILAFFSYSLPNMLAGIVLIIAVVIGIVNLAKKRIERVGFDLTMTAVAGILYAILSSSAYSAAFPS